jgi:hypothetical protein
LPLTGVCLGDPTQCAPLLGGNVHSFTNPAVDALANPALRYDAAAEARAWRAMLGLFDEVF